VNSINLKQLYVKRTLKYRFILSVEHSEHRTYGKDKEVLFGMSNNQGD
jgi:hypothetical protein